LVATHAGEAGVAEIFRALTNRLRDSTWTIVFKSMIIVHLMIREGEPEVTLKYLAQNPHRKLAINSFTEGTSSSMHPAPREKEATLRMLVGIQQEIAMRQTTSLRKALFAQEIADEVRNSANPRPQYPDLLRIPPPTRN
jgi:hypothetical protein